MWTLSSVSLKLFVLNCGMYVLPLSFWSYFLCLVLDALIQVFVGYLVVPDKNPALVCSEVLFSRQAQLLGFSRNTVNLPQPSIESVFTV